MLGVATGSVREATHILHPVDRRRFFVEIFSFVNEIFFIKGRSTSLKIIR